MFGLHHERESVLHYTTWFISLLAIVLSGCSSLLTESHQTYEGTEIGDTAPAFLLTNQHGEEISLSDFQGKVVILTFMDTECIDTCPITALHLRQTFERLESDADKVVFLGINVNPESAGIEDLADASEKWQLDELPDWHFLTGNQSDLEQVWTDYFVGIQHGTTGNIMHTSGVFIIDKSGQRRWYLSTPEDDPNWQGPPLDEVLYPLVKQILDEAG